MYCLQWLLPLLLVPKPVWPLLVAQAQYAAFFSLYVLSFILKRKPCLLCTAVFLTTCLLLCWSGLDTANCLFWLNTDPDTQGACHAPPAVPKGPLPQLQL